MNKYSCVTPSTHTKKEGISSTNTQETNYFLLCNTVDPSQHKIYITCSEMPKERRPLSCLAMLKLTQKP